MSDIIKLLPDHVANQIAAGEVIQRPASVVKELLENAIDAGADEIQLNITDSGKTLIQLIDNGKGMSDTDVRLSIERHATSKIRTAEDLFSINTFGFRGEALASIAAISYLEIQSKRAEDEMGTHLIVEGSEVKSQNPTVMNQGTNIRVRNLFFNVPARRNFLKSDQVEYRHILEEFYRIALVNSHIHFSMHHNNTLQLMLEKNGLKRRIIDIFGENLNKKLVPIQSENSLLNIEGFIGKPEFSQKKRGEQYFFVNNRFIKHGYFHHAVIKAYEELLPEGHFPSYFIFFSVAPDKIDINIHPTKTEVNFTDGQLLYPIIVSAIRQGIGKFNIGTSIDFDIDQSLLGSPMTDKSTISQPSITVDPTYNPFTTEKQWTTTEKIRSQHNLQQWETLFGASPLDDISPSEHNSSTESDAEAFSSTIHEKEQPSPTSLLHVGGQFIVTNVKSGLMIIDQTAAHERILYERYLEQLSKRESGSQQQLFPQNVTFSLADAELIRELSSELKCIGFYIETLGKNSFVVNGIPDDLNPNENMLDFLDSLLECFKSNQIHLKTNRNINLALSLAKNMSVKKGKVLDKNEMQSIIDSLFGCQVPHHSPSGKPTVTILKAEELMALFNK